jgi:hypothetical protein
MVRIVALLVLLAGCGGGSGGNSQAVSDCNGFIANSYCPKITQCLGLSQSDCLTAAHMGLNCSAVKGEDGELTVCESDLANDPCSQFYYAGTVTLPPTCVGVFLQ